MAFSISEYLAGMETRLTHLSRVARLAFALWCCSELWGRFADSLRVCIGLEKANSLAEFVDALWNYAIYGRPPSRETVAKVREVYRAIETPDFQLDAGSEHAGFGAIELLGCIQKCVQVFEHDSAKAAAGCAEHVINWRDHELAFALEQQDTLSHPKMLQELDNQHRMLEYLNEKNEITEEDKSRFRA